MNSINEGSFREKLGRAKYLLTTISDFKNYSPTRPEDQIEGMTVFINELTAVNARVATLKDSQKSLTDDRKEAFLGKGESLQNLIIQIKAAVESQYGKKTSEATMINRSIALMRDVKPKKAVPEAANETEETRSNKVEKSYGSMAEVLNDIISSLSNYPDYATSNEKVKIEALRETSAKLDNYNARVTKIKLETNTAQDERVKMYEELNTRAQRIKTYVKGQYGVNSREYISIKSLRF